MSKHRFLLLWIGQCLSTIGSGLTAFALGVFAFETTQSATSYALVLLCAFLPSIALRPLGGVLADRMDRRVAMMIGDVGSALGVLFIGSMLWLGHREMWWIYSGVALSSLFLALQNPAYKASVSDLLDKEHYAKASGLVQLSEASRHLISPFLASIFLRFWSLETLLMIDIATFCFAILTLIVVKKGEKKIKENAEPLLDSLKKGFSFVYSDRTLFSLLGVTTLLTFFVGFFQALLGPRILSFSTPETLGTIQSFSAIGMLVSSLWIGTLCQQTKNLRMLSLSLLSAGCFYILLGVFQEPILLITFGFGFFFTLPYINTTLEVLIRNRVPNDIQGRVWSIISLVSQSGMVVAFAIAGPLADHLFEPLFQFNGKGTGCLFVLSGAGIIASSQLLKWQQVFDIQVERTGSTSLIS